MQDSLGPLKGRGALSNPPNRFELMRYERDPDTPPEECPAPATQFLRDKTRSIIATNDSPDVYFDASINPYRGCEHACIYCFARPFHEYLGFSAGLDFETKILVKEDAPQLLRRELNSRKWRPQVLGLSGVTDPYQPIERKLRITRGCLEVLRDFRNPVAIVTKNHLVARDVDLLAELAQHHAAHVCVSVTTLDEKLAGIMEPRASRPAGRLEAIRTLSGAGVPVTVLMAPIIPGLTDHEIVPLLAAARAAGASHASWVMLRLPHAVKELFVQWLEQHFLEKKDKILARLRDMRGGQLYDSRFGTRKRGEGEVAATIGKLFDLAYRKAGFPGDGTGLSTAAFRRPEETPSLFPEEC